VPVREPRSWLKAAPRAILVEPDAITGRFDGELVRVAAWTVLSGHPLAQALLSLQPALLAQQTDPTQTAARWRDEYSAVHHRCTGCAVRLPAVGRRGGTQRRNRPGRGVAMANERAFDHVFNGRFRIEIEGVTQASFMQCSGLEAQVDVVHFTNADDAMAHKRPGQTRYANIVLRRGFINTEDLWQWFKKVCDGKIERRSGSVIVCDDDGSEVCRYNFFEGWPCRWKSMEFDTARPGSLIEELEIAVEKIERG
jgi:phage tail-like protein